MNAERAVLCERSNDETLSVETLLNVESGAWTGNIRCDRLPVGGRSGQVRREGEERTWLQWGSPWTEPGDICSLTVIPPGDQSRSSLWRMWREVFAFPAVACLPEQTRRDHFRSSWQGSETTVTSYKKFECHLCSWTTRSDLSFSFLVQSGEQRVEEHWDAASWAMTWSASPYIYSFETHENALSKAMRQEKTTKKGKYDIKMTSYWSKTMLRNNKEKKSLVYNLKCRLKRRELK